MANRSPFLGKFSLIFLARISESATEYTSPRSITKAATHKSTKSNFSEVTDVLKTCLRGCQKLRFNVLGEHAA